MTFSVISVSPSVEISASSGSEAATSTMRASSKAGRATAETSSSVASRTCMTPLRMSCLLTRTPTLNPSRSCSLASTSKSVPAVVLVTFALPMIPAGVGVNSMKRPTGRVASCSISSLMLPGSSRFVIDPTSKMTGPRLVRPGRPNGTIMPVSVLESASAAVMLAANLICICVSSRCQVHHGAAFLDRDQVCLDHAFDNFDLL